MSILHYVVSEETTTPPNSHSKSSPFAACSPAISSPPYEHRRYIGSATTKIMTNDNSDADTNHHKDGELRISPTSGAGADDPGATEQDVDSFNNNIPVFLDRAFRMVENVPDDVVGWSEAGHSFIIKQARVRKRSGRDEAPQGLLTRSQSSLPTNVTLLILNWIR